MRSSPGLLRHVFSGLRGVAPAVVASALALAASSCARDTTPSVDCRPALTISVVGTSDLHGGVLPEEGRGGLALLDGYLRNLRAARQSDGGGVLLLDAGDLFQGTLESNLNEGQVVVAVYNALGYAAAAVGNHEFDYGPIGEAATPVTPQDDPRGALKARAAEARVPVSRREHHRSVDRATGELAERAAVGDRRRRGRARGRGRPDDVAYLERNHGREHGGPDHRSAGADARRGSDAAAYARGRRS